MRFNVAFGKNNVFSIDLRPVTNLQWLQDQLDKDRAPAQADYDNANNDPFGASFIGTLEKARSLCEGGTVVFA